MTIFLSLMNRFRRIPVWLSATALVIAILVFPAGAFASSPVEHTIRIDAGRFAFSPAQVQVNPGDRVTLEVAAQDVSHGIHIDGYNLEVAAEPGRTARLTFVADRPGTFRLRCSVTCGPLHPFMIGKLAVGPNWLLVKAMLATVVVGFLGLIYRLPAKNE